MDLNDGTGGAGGDGGQGAAAALLGEGGAGAGGAGGEGGGGSGEGSGEGGGVADPDWYAQVSGEAEGEEPSLRDWAKSRGYKTLDEVLKSARDNQKAVREGGRVKVPGEGASEAEIAEFRKAIGVPEAPDGYKLPALKDAAGNDVPMNSAKLEAITRIAHEEGLPAAPLERVLQRIAESDANEIAANEIEMTQKAGAHAKSWGAERESKLEAVDQAAARLKLGKDDLLGLRAVLGAERALDMLAEIGSGLREDTLVNGDKRPRFAGDPVAAQKRLDEMKATPGMYDKIQVPGSAERTEWDRLEKIVGEAANRKAAEDNQ